jgi:hypothetical protein
MQSNKLDTIKDRYFFLSKKSVLHYGDCDIYQATRPFCSCGLIYQLNYLDYDFASIIYPKYSDDSYLQDHGKKRRLNKKKDAENKKLFEEVFGILEPPSFEDIKQSYDSYNKALSICFMPKEFPGAFKRLEKWLIKQVERD